MAEKLIANIHATFDAYTHKIRPLIARICNHAQSQENLANLFEQASDYLIVFKQDFEANSSTLLKFLTDLTDLEPLLTTFRNQYELLLKFVGLVFSFALADMTIDIDDYPVLEPLVWKMKGSKKHTDYCLDSLRLFMAGTHPQHIPPFIEDNSPPTPQNPSTPVAPQDHPTIKTEDDNSPPILQNPNTPVNPQDHITIKTELDNSAHTPQNSNTLVVPQDYLTIKTELDNGSLMPQDPNNPASLPNPDVTISIKAAVDTDSQPMAIETLYDLDMDSLETPYDHDIDSNYDSYESDYSDFEDLEGEFLEVRERKFLLIYGTSWKHIPPTRYIEPFG